MFLFVVLFTSAKTYDYMYFENYGILDFFQLLLQTFTDIKPHGIIHMSTK